ncbi:competence/damage-inducible protein A [Mycoplasmatota bacterium]|nr:competence/damage-inducible protein A [Mycoplasmatota bacterium]
MKVAILTIGDEVVSGKIVNTNASYLAKILETNQLIVSRHLAVRDETEEILNGLSYLYQNANVVITTGGLGPTVDDLTKEVCATYFHEEMVLYPHELDHLKSIYEKMNRKMPDINIKQAHFIKNSTVIRNNNGTAPGMIYENKEKVIINLPGPPKELEPMLIDEVIPYLKNKINGEVLKKQYRLMHIGESNAETMIKPLYQKYPNIKIAPYASVGTIDYMLSVSKEGNEDSFNHCCQSFESYLKDYIIGDWSNSLQEIIVKILTEKSLTLAIAESCTGGMVTSSIVDVSGSSAVLKEAMVTYSNVAKEKRLGVKKETLLRCGAVSSETAREMAIGVKETSHADIGLSVTGIAGPTGGTKEKPVGLVYTAVHWNGQTYVFKNNFNGDRYKVRLRSTMEILYSLYQLLIKTL